jgi:hypothetical protein
MVRKALTSLFLLIIITNLHAQLKSPEDFLGYKIGSRFTPHWKIVSYFNHVAANSSATVNLQQYGQTNEGRPLLVTFISSPENMQRLEQVRMNNLRLAGMSKDRAAAIEENAPAIVWLSYNVHGNETSSSEAAMLTLWALVDPANNNTKQWLKNIVVAIDPCINPDGRDRYVNWFNSIVGKNVNPQIVSREHREPWPGGRTNHYNFDLNRDWAWQTQVETQQRMKIYSQWMPEIHVDYHEQGINDPYYFAPAAEPFHEVITPWQREFQNSIGRNNAKYFDANGWLYYTRELFDLFYPSYGDTYPLYNGAIGMTYEQAGHSASGAAVINDEGDTLTLYDRAIHHFTTGMSTIEIASQNAARLVKEFHRFFNEGQSSGFGEYKSYVIRNEPRNRERIDALLDLLDKNGIQYGTTNGSGKGYHYSVGREENFSYGGGDIVVSAYQPKSALVKVLFEPKSKLADSATYDITAWALPYVYGLDAYATRDRINPGPMPMKAAISNPATSYGYAIPWTGIKSVKLIGKLLQKRLLLRYAEQPFDINGQHFDRGSVLVLKTANRSFGNELLTDVRRLADEAQVQITPIGTGFVDKGFDFGSDKVHPFRMPKVAMLTGEGVDGNAAGEVWFFFDQQLDYPITLINTNDFGRVNLSDIDVLILPDGNYKFLSDKTPAGTFKDWINKGGRVIAMESAVGVLSRADFGIKTRKSEDSKDEKDSLYSDLRKFEGREKSDISNSTPGSIYRVDLDNTHPLAYGYPNYYYTLKLDGSVYDFFDEDGWNVGVIKKDSYVAGFVGAKLKPKLKDALVMGVQPMGAGSITYFADDMLFRNFWENGKLMFCNAVFFVGQ